ncbi:MAG TPA: aminotransferase class I/II-fold pyridoxal phosphate-dependent enzyme [Bacteroidales bacterium]|nr:aminotransferase class I/II-fold pyridoxal phosphate-dependent enzyme [Bacteroidales bacterium]
MTQKIGEISTLSDDSLQKLIKESGAINMTSLLPSEKGFQEFFDSNVDIYNFGMDFLENINPYQKLSNYTLKKYFRAINPETEIAFVGGVNLAVFLAIASSVKDGDSVIVFEPFTSNLKAAVELCGARPVYIPLKGPEFKIDWCEVQRAINATTKLMVISSPHLLTGQALTAEDYEELQRLINGTKIKLVINESMVELGYKNHEGTSVNFYPRLCQVTYRVGSLNIPVALADSEIAYCIAPEQLMATYRNIHSAIAANPNLSRAEDYINILSVEIEGHMLADFLEENYKKLLEALKESKFQPIRQTAGYMVMIGYKNYADIRDVEMVEKLIVEKGVGLLPLSWFYHDRQCHRYVAMNITLPQNEFREAIDRLASL